MFTESKFDGTIFKTNLICMENTRRQHMVFTIKELESFPEYMDLNELIENLIATNSNKNIIYTKNPR